MVDTVFPTPNTYTARQGRQTQAAALAGATAARPLGALSGVRPGTPSTTVTTTTTTVTVQPFAGIADVQTSSIAGPYSFAFDAAQTFALVAQSATVPRSDIVYVQISDNQEDGTGAANSSSAARGYQAGTTVAIPAAPARSFIIAVINVPITGSSPTVSWVAPYAVAAGGTLPTSTKAILDTIPGSYVGQVAEVFADTTTANNRIWFWSGSAWVWSLNGSTPFAQASGTGSNAAGVTTAVTFPAGRFTVAPIVTMANTGSSVSALNVQGLTASGATMGGFNSAGTPIVSTWMWTAVQMTPTAAAG